jgi:hypothetical protein
MVMIRDDKHAKPSSNYAGRLASLRSWIPDEMAVFGLSTYVAQPATVQTILCRRYTHWNFRYHLRKTGATSTDHPDWSHLEIHANGNSMGECKKRRNVDSSTSASAQRHQDVKKWKSLYTAASVKRQEMILKRCEAKER